MFYNIIHYTENIMSLTQFMHTGIENVSQSIQPNSSKKKKKQVINGKLMKLPDSLIILYFGIKVYTCHPTLYAKKIY